MDSKSEIAYLSIDIEELVKKYTWKRFVKTKPLLRRPFYMKSHFTIDFNWAYLNFKHETTKFNIRKNAVHSHEAEVATGSQESNFSQRNGVDGNGEKDVVLYKSRYVNDTPVDQLYNFSTARETKASCTVEIQNTFTKGNTYSIGLNVPSDYVTLSSSRNDELTISNSKAETFEETMTWSINHNIKVVKGHTAVATMVVSERNSTADFEIKTTVSLPDGKDLPVFVRRVSDNLIVYVEVVNDLEFVFADVAKRNEYVTFEPTKDETRGLLRKNVILTTNGTCKSVSWKKHNVRVKSVLKSSMEQTIAEDEGSTSSGVGDSVSTSSDDEGRALPNDDEDGQ